MILSPLFKSLERNDRKVKEKMQKSFSLIQTVAISGVFSAVSCWYGFMFGRESARKELGGLIEELRRGSSDSTSPHHPS